MCVCVCVCVCVFVRMCTHAHRKRSGSMLVVVFSGRGLITEIMGDFHFLIYIFLYCVTFY